MNLARFLPVSTSARVAWAIVFFLVVYQMVYGFSPTMISWDTYGYYLYLPQTFLHGDLGIHDYTPIESALNGPVVSGTFYQAAKSDLNLWVIKYPIGLAIFYLPFFLIGCFIAWIGNFPMDGFSLPFQYAMTAGSLFYMAIGIWLVRKILLHFFSEKVTCLALLFLVFGTNYYHMHTHSHGMPHVYLFTAYAALIWLTIRWHADKKLFHALGLGLVLGLMTVSRVTEFIAILIPLCYGIQSPKHFFQRIWRAWRVYKHLILAFLGFFLLLFPQLLYWKVFGGAWLYDSYRNPGEGLDFLHPHTLDFLFSYRKGWFIYTPIMLLAIWGLFRAFKEKTTWRWTFLGLVLCFIYVASSWTTWWYAASFSQRTMVQLYPVLAVPLGLALTKNGGIRKGVFVFALGCTFLNLFQTWQYNRGIIHIDRMTGSYYWKVFGQLEVPPGAQDYLLVDRSMNAIENFSEPSKYELYKRFSLALKVDYLEESLAPLSDTIQLLPQRYSPKFEQRFDELSSKDHAWLNVTGRVHADSAANFDLLRIITTFEHKGEAYKYHNDPLKTYLLWNPKGYFDLSLWYLTPEVRRPENQFQLYFENAGTADTIGVTHLSISVLQRLDKFD